MGINRRTFMAASISAALAGQGAADDARGIDMRWDVRIPMRDGVRLGATVFGPHAQKEPLPVIFTLTPYVGDTYHARARYFAARGYAFALVDVRGRGNSEGVFAPFENEGRDGHDVVEWLARQPWCNGKVAMWGGSYAGFDQWSTLKEFPPHLATIVPAAAAAMGVDFPAFNNVHAPYLMQWRMYTSGRTPNLNLFLDQPFWISKFRELSLGHRAFREFDAIAGNPSEWFQNLLKHPTQDSYWKSMNPTAEDYARITIPILTITGHYDDDQPGALHHYRSHMTHGQATAKVNHFLLMGPWDHAGTRTPKRDVGGLTFGESSLLDLNALHKEWYDWTMKGGPRPGFLKDRVTYYVAAADEWKQAPSIEAVSTKTRTLYLGSKGDAGDASRAGFLDDAKPRASTPDAFVYDPLDVRPAELEKDEIAEPITDQRFVMNTFGNGVVYQSEPFDEDKELSGAPRLVVWLKMDVPDTDLQVSLYEVRRDGRSVLLTGDLMRTRYRESLERETLVKPGEILRYEFKSFTWFSRRVAAGSRLRLFLRCPNSIFLEKNYNSGGVVADETAKDARTAHISVYHDAEHPSAVEIPIVE